MKLRRTYKYKLHPNRKQTTILESTLDTCRFLYNSALQERRDAYAKNHISLNYYDQQNELPLCKEEIPELNEVYAQVLQDVLRRLDKSFKAFFRRIKIKEKAGYPRFKSRDRYNSFTYTQGGFKTEGNKVVLSKIGAIRINLNRPIQGRIKQLAVLRKNGKWYACFSVEIEKDVKKREIKNSVGIDMGIASFLTTSEGEKVKNPKWFRQSEDKLAMEQRRLSRKKRGSSNRSKQRSIVSKVHEKIGNQRKDFHHKLSKQMVTDYDLIAYEDLNIRGMVRNHKLSKSITDAGWGQFISMLEYKAEEAGVSIIGVNPRNTSQMCSSCNALVKKLLHERVHVCPDCGLTMDRDVNAAINILKIGLGKPESTLVEMAVGPSLKQEYPLLMDNSHSVGPRTV